MTGTGFTTGKRPGVGGIVAEKCFEKIMDVRRKCEMILVFKLLAGKILETAVSAYAPQAGIGEDIKVKFWSNLSQTQSSEVGT